MTCGVYEFWCGPHFYQGSSKNIERRWKDHLSLLKAGRHENDRAQKAYDKYGWTDAGILVECEEHALIAWEQAYIDTNWGDEKYLNLNPTADRLTHTPEMRAKISAARKARPISDEHRAKLKGRTVSEETRAKIGAAHKGQTHSDEARAKISAANKSRVHSAETRAKMSASQKLRRDAEKMGADIIELFGMEF